MACAVISVHICLAEQCPAFVADSEQGRECISVTELRYSVHRSISAVKLLIARLCTFPAYHGVALRGKECRCAVWKTETCFLLVYDHGSGLASVLSRYDIAHGHIIVAYPALHRHGIAAVVLKIDFKHIGVVVYTAFLYFILTVSLFYDIFCHVCYFHTMTEVTGVSNEAEWRF